MYSASISVQDMPFHVFVRDLCGFKGTWTKNPASSGHQGAGLRNDPAAEQRDIDQGELASQTVGH